jgi:hypothetical protein
MVLALSTLLILTLGSPVVRFDVEAAGGTPQPPSSSAEPQSQPTMQDMMKMHGQMMAEMKAASAKLDALVKDMNAATGEAKINALSAVVTELVNQQKAMHERMGQMHQQTMGGRGMMMNR